MSIANNNASSTATGAVRIRRFAIVLAVLWTGGLAGYASWYYHSEREGMLEIGRVAARSAFARDYLFQHETLYQAVYVAATDPLHRSGHVNVRDQNIATPSGRHLTLVNKANMVRQVSRMFPERNEARGHIASLHPLRPENAPDAWETLALQAFERGKTEASQIQQVDGHPYMRLMRPLVAEQGCLKCHALGFRSGSIQGGISVTIPMASLQQAYSREKSGFLLANGFIWVIGLGTIGVGSRKIIKKTSDIETSEEKIRFMVNSIREIIFQLDLSGAWLFLNPAWTDLTG